MSVGIETFHQIMDRLDCMSVGVNGASVYNEKEFNDDMGLLYNLYTTLTRDLDKEQYDKLAESIFERVNSNNKLLAYFAVMAFYTRDIREGLGERRLFYWMLENLVKYENVFRGLMRVVHEYGSWHDYYRMLDNIKNENVEKMVINIYIAQLKKDIELYKSGEIEKISLAAKWLPREKSKYSTFYKKVASEMKMSYKELRKIVAELSKETGVVEQKMCANEYAKIVPKLVPSVCLKKNRKAFLNLKKDGSTQRSEKEDRIKCAENFNISVEKGEQLKGRTVRPDQIVNEINNIRNKTAVELDILENQWKDIVISVQEKVEKSKFQDLLVLADTSGSMSSKVGDTTCLNVSVGLALLLSELAGHNRFLTFESEPHWMNLSECSRLRYRVNRAYLAPWGGSTNFEAAMMCVLNALPAKTPVTTFMAGGEIAYCPKMVICITDMGFDSASDNSWNKTVVDELRKKFEDKGYELPKLVIWNVSGKFKGQYHHDKEDLGVYTISGWSKNIINYILSGEDFLSKINTPVDQMLEVLNSERYKQIYDIVMNTK